MPQPTTHYLVVRRAIPKEHWNAWWDKYKPYFGLGSSAPDLFYFPSVENVIRKIFSTPTYTSELSNLLHEDRSYDMFCTLLSMAKESRLNLAETDVAEKQFAFSFGFYTHVVADCVFHPYVYRNTGDHWATEDFNCETEHKIEEFKIDRGIHRMVRKRNQTIGTTDWKCHGQSDTLLDYAIADLLNKALLKTYPQNFTSKTSISNNKHPIQAAYQALNKLIPYLFSGQKVYLWGSKRIINNPKIEKYSHFFTKKI